MNLVPAAIRQIIWDGKNRLTSQQYIHSANFATTVHNTRAFNATASVSIVCITPAQYCNLSWTQNRHIALFSMGTTCVFYVPSPMQMQPCNSGQVLNYSNLNDFLDRLKNSQSRKVHCKKIITVNEWGCESALHRNLPLSLSVWAALFHPLLAWTSSGQPDECCWYLPSIYRRRLSFVEVKYHDPCWKHDSYYKYLHFIVLSVQPSVDELGYFCLEVDKKCLSAPLVSDQMKLDTGLVRPYIQKSLYSLNLQSEANA